jgi:hypothetical protein
MGTALGEGTPGKGLPAEAFLGSGVGSVGQSIDNVLAGHYAVKCIGIIYLPLVAIAGCSPRVTTESTFARFRFRLENRTTFAVARPLEAYCFRDRPFHCRAIVSHGKERHLRSFTVGTPSHQHELIIWEVDGINNFPTF